MNKIEVRSKIVPPTLRPVYWIKFLIPFILFSVQKGKKNWSYCYYIYRMLIIVAFIYIFCLSKRKEISLFHRTVLPNMFCVLLFVFTLGSIVYLIFRPSGFQYYTRLVSITNLGSYFDFIHKIVITFRALRALT